MNMVEDGRTHGPLELQVHASDTGRAFIFDCAQNMGGMVRLTLPAGACPHVADSPPVVSLLLSFPIILSVPNNGHSIPSAFFFRLASFSSAEPFACVWYAGHGIPAGTELRIEHGEIVQGVDHGIAQMCLICPKCGSCGSHSGGASGAGGNSNCDPRGKGAVCDT